jgi:hypothetical protein
MAVKKRGRKSLSLRLQPYEGTLLAEVIDYLNTLDKDEMNRQIAEILIISMLPLARYDRGVSEQELRVSTLESCRALFQQAHFLRQLVGVQIELPTVENMVEVPLVKETRQKLIHPKSDFGSVDGLDDLFNI